MCVYACMHASINKISLGNYVLIFGGNVIMSKFKPIFLWFCLFQFEKVSWLLYRHRWIPTIPKDWNNP